MRSFSFLEENNLFVATLQQKNTPTLIGATKGSDPTIIYPAATATKQEIQKLKLKINSKRHNLLANAKDSENDDIKSITNLKDWFITNSITKAIQLKHPTKQQSIELIDSLNTTISAGEEAFIEGYLACHRGDGVFTLTIDSESHDFTFDTKHNGGSNPENYQHISIPIKAKPGTITINASIKHSKSSEEGAIDCFYFVGDLCLNRKINCKPLITPRINGTIPKNQNANFYKIKVEKFLQGNKSPLYLEWSNGQRRKYLHPSYNQHHSQKTTIILLKSNLRRKEKQFACT